MLKIVTYKNLPSRNHIRKARKHKYEELFLRKEKSKPKTQTSQQSVVDSSPKDGLLPKGGRVPFGT